MLLQTESAECGLACLTMVAGYYGHITDIATLRRRFSISTHGATLAQLIEFANVLQLISRPLRLELEELVQLSTPCILHWDLNHFIVLKQIKNKRVVIHDPAFGIRELDYEEVSKHFTGIALELAPSPAFVKQEETQSIGLRSLIGHVIGLKRSLLQVFLLSTALEVFSVLAPFFQQWVIDGVIVQNNRDLLMVLALGFLLLTIFQLAIGTVRSWLIIYFSTQLSLQWTASVFTHLLRLPVCYFEKRHLGDLVSRFGAIETIRQTLTSTALGSLLDGMMAVIAFAMMLFYSVPLALVTLSALLLYVIIRVVSYSPFRVANEEQIMHAAKQQSHFLESLRGIQSIKLFGHENNRRSQWMNLVVNTTNRGLATQKMSTFFQSANSLVFGVESIAVTYLGAVYVMDHKFSIGMFFAYGAYKTQFSSRVGSLVDLFFQVRMLRIQRERLADIVLTETEELHDFGQVTNNINPDIELRNIRFRYSATDPWVLDGVNLTIDSGQSVAIVGQSGCGKTTLLKIMLGLLVPTEGEILVGGVPLQQLGLLHWRRILAAVMQDDQLFAGSIADNITFFADKVDRPRIEEVSRLASIHDDIVKMPMGYSTLIGDMGVSLSGGQKQRLLVARALYKNPKVLFLDEATSHLDVERERWVNEAIGLLPLTRVIIAHRPETIAMAGRVIKLDRGKVVTESSPHPFPVRGELPASVMVSAESNAQ